MDIIGTGDRFDMVRAATFKKVNQKIDRTTEEIIRDVTAMVRRLRGR